MGEVTTVTVTQQTDEVSHIELELTSEGVSGWVSCSGADSRNPAVFRPFDEWCAGGDGDELRKELSRPKKYLEEETSRKPRNEDIVQQRRLINERPQRFV